MHAVLDILVLDEILWYEMSVVDVYKEVIYVIDPNELIGSILTVHYFAISDISRLRNAFSDQILFIAEVGANLKRFF